MVRSNIPFNKPHFYLDLSTVPTRASLIADLTTSRVQSIIPQELLTLYEALETDFRPLNLTEKIQPALKCISEREDLAIYMEPLQEVVVSKTLLQLAQVYRTLHFDQLARLCPFYDPLTLERCVVELIYNLELPMRVDHRRNAIIFDVYIDLGISQRDYSSGLTGGDQVSRQLTVFTQALQSVAELLNLSESSTRCRDKMVKEYVQTAKEEHRAMLERVPLIEERKEHLEQMQREKLRVMRVSSIYLSISFTNLTPIYTFRPLKKRKKKLRMINEINAKRRKKY